MVHGLEADYWGRIDFVYIDREAAANQDVVQRFGITSQPIFIFLAPDGTEIVGSRLAKRPRYNVW